MRYPRKFQPLLETTIVDVEQPNIAWLTYAVCAMTYDACGWAGWILEAVFGVAREGETFRALPMSDKQVCPRCGRMLFRTAASLRFELSDDQTNPHGVAGKDYEVTAMEYEE